MNLIEVNRDERMKPPKQFKINQRVHGYSICDGCQKWKHNLIFHHEGKDWILCVYDYTDYWENTDTLLPDYKGY